MKIGRYTEDEILEHLTEGEGRSFLGRSMYDAIFDKIHALITENEQLKNDNADLKERYNNMFECHCNRVQVEQLQNNWNELKNGLESWLENDKYCYLAENPIDKCRCEVYKELLDKMQELQGDDKN